MTDFRYTPLAIKTIRDSARKMSAATIAAFMGCDVSMIEHICREQRIEIRAQDCGEPESEQQSPEREAVLKALRIQIDDSVFRTVKREARRRGLNTHTLVERLIERIAEDDVFSAVLDR